MKKNILLIFLFCISLVHAFAQLENVRVETYYISDINDATDTIGGGLETRSFTYRVYIDLEKGYRLKRIYGDENHALKISSTQNFFNNKEDGQTFGKDFSKVRLGENTVALDSWLTLGQTTKIAARTYFGIPKTADTDGSFIGGSNNDGGSAEIPDGLLANNDPDAGIPLTDADGFDTMAVLPLDWGHYGIIDSVSLVDSTIFGSVKVGNSFISYNAKLQNSGVTGVDPDSNIILVAQLTTKGDLNFELNIVVLDSTGHEIKFVANDSVLANDETLSRKLKYPFREVCGCPDPNYIEFISSRTCDALDSCHNLVVYGCMDTSACNYNPDANFHIQSLCCYPGYCNDRDITLICPELNYKLHGALNFNLFPNPAHDQITLQAPASESMIKYSIYDCLGKIVKQDVIDATSQVTSNIDISFLEKGMYVFKMENGNTSDQVLFIKN
jgi:hypothetical protein